MSLSRRSWAPRRIQRWIPTIDEIIAVEDKNGFPILNPRDLVRCFVEELQKLDAETEFLLVVTDPRDRRSMSIEQCLSEETKGHVLRNLVLGFYPLDEDMYEPTIMDRDAETDD